MGEILFLQWFPTHMIHRWICSVPPSWWHLKKLVFNIQSTMMAIWRQTNLKSNLVFYTQSTNTVISGQLSNENIHFKLLLFLFFVRQWKCCHPLTWTSNVKYFFKFLMIITRKGSLIPSVFFGSAGHVMNVVLKHTKTQNISKQCLQNW